MIPYLILMFVPLLGSFVMFSRQNGKRTVVLGGTSRVLDHSCMLPMFFSILLILLCLRDETIGRDLANYKYYFKKIAAMEFGALFQMDLDRLYVLLNWIVARFTDDFQVFLAVAAVLSVLPMAQVYCEDREHGFLKIILFMNMSTFIMLFSGLRQAIAVAVGFRAYQAVRRKQLLPFFLYALIALGFHHSAFMILFFYPLYHMTFQKKHLWFVIPAVLLVFVFNRQIFSTASAVLMMLFSEKYAVKIDETGAYTMLILFGMFAAMSYLLPGEERMDEETLGLRNFLVFAVVLQCFAPIHTLAMRLNYYYIAFIPILIPKILKYSGRRSAGVVRLTKTAMIAVLGAYYLMTTYNSCRTGVSALDTYPYVPFWE